MTNLLALAVGYILTKMFDVVALQQAATRSPTTTTPPRRRPAASTRRPTAAPAATPTTTTRPQSLPVATTPPWPQVTPTGLPSFPGAGWEPDNPPPPAVVSRAVQLLPQLWQGGEGTFKVEQTAGRWIAYRATTMGGKKGVVAFRESSHAQFLTPPGPATPESDEPAAPAVTRTTSSTALPLLKRGSKGEEVRIVQRKLGLLPVDGDFGPATEAGVKNFQARNGLSPDGKVGPQTWAALMGRGA